MNKRKLITLAIFILIAIAITPFLTDIIREIIVIPLLYLLWIVRIIFEALPQGIIWGMIVVILFFIMVISLLEKTKLRRSRPPLRGTHQERVQSWLKLIRQAEQDGYFKWRLAQRMQKLGLESISHQTGQSLKETRRQLKDGTLDLPPDLLAYFQASLRPLGYISASRGLFSRKPVSSPLDLDPVRIVKYLEELNLEPTPTNSKESE